MSAFITSTICGVIMNISVFYIIKIITKSNEKIYKLKNILLLLALAIIYAVLYTEKYNITYTIINYLSVIICIKTIFKDNMTKTVISTILAMIIIIISDSLNSDVRPNVIFVLAKPCFSLSKNPMFFSFFMFISAIFLHLYFTT